jgi:hypothetical protein
MPIRIVTCLMQLRHGDNLFVQLHVFHSHYCTLVTVGVARENCGGQIAGKSVMSSGEVARLRGAFRLRKAFLLREAYGGT